MTSISFGLSGGSSPEAAPAPARPYAPGAEAVTFAHPPGVIAGLMRAMVPPPRSGPGARRLARWALVAAVLAGAAAALAIDDALAFPRGAFAWLVPFSWLGVVAVLNATHPQPRAFPSWLRGPGWIAGCVAMAVLGVLGMLGFGIFVEPFAAGRREAHSWGFWMLGSLIAIVAGLVVGRVFRAGGERKSDEAARLNAAAEFAEALADDAAPGKPASGWIDVSGPEQPSKRVREGTAASGATVTLYRDEWLRLRLALRDGNRLRLSAVDRVKVRAGRWKRGLGGKQKWKSGRTDWLSTLELRLSVNPALYRVKAEAPQGAHASAVQVGGSAAAPTLALVQSTGSKSFEPALALGGAASLYARLERVSAAP